VGVGIWILIFSLGFLAVDRSEEENEVTWLAWRLDEGPTS